jgi:hypothetical protein
MPSQLRRLIRAQGRDLHEEFKQLLPAPVTPIAIQRWSWRRVLLTIGVLFAVLIGVAIVIPLLGSPL